MRVDYGVSIAQVIDSYGPTARAWAADLYDEHGTYFGTVRVDMEDEDRCANGECNCTTMERVKAGALFLTDEDPEIPEAEWEAH